jgi:hypothetical protein
VICASRTVLIAVITTTSLRACIAERWPRQNRGCVCLATAPAVGNTFRRRRRTGTGTRIHAARPNSHESRPSSIGLPPRLDRPNAYQTHVAVAVTFRDAFDCLTERLRRVSNSGPTHRPFRTIGAVVEFKGQSVRDD